MLTLPKKQHGFVLVAVIFLVVVIGASIAVMSRLSGTTITSSTLSLLGTRAELAAASGMEWAIYQIRNPVNAGINCTAMNGTSISITAYSNLTISVNCNNTSFNDSIELFSISVSAEFGVIGDTEYVWRELTAVVEP